MLLFLIGRRDGLGLVVVPMIDGKYLKTKYPWESRVLPHHPISFGSVVKGSWSELSYFVYHTGDYDGKWFIQAYPLKNNAPNTMGCGWFNGLGRRRGNKIECDYKNPDDEVLVIWEPQTESGQMELGL